MKKPVFMLSRRGMDPLPTPYYPLIYTRMHDAWRFALHKSGRHWVVSDIASGARVCWVSASYKGMPIASGTLTLAQARQCALADIDAIVDRIGFERFAAVLANPKPF